MMRLLLLFFILIFGCVNIQEEKEEVEIVETKRGILCKPKEKWEDGIVLSHGTGGNAHSLMMWCKFFAENGYITFAHTFRGETGEGMVKDVLNAIDYIKNFRVKHIAVWGISAGATISLLAATRSEDVDAVIEIAGHTAVPLFDRRGEAEYWEGPKYYLEDMSAPVLILWGEKDDVAPVDDGYSLCERLKGLDKSVILYTFPNYGHDICGAMDKEILDIQLDFLKKVFSGERIKTHCGG